MEKIMGFWKNDTFPYTLCGEITKILPKGIIQTKEYGTMAFRAIFILEYEEGLKVKEELRKLEINFKNDTLKVREKYTNELKQLLGQYREEL